MTFPQNVMLRWTSYWLRESCKIFMAFQLGADHGLGAFWSLQQCAFVIIMRCLYT
jgi:hypothetical protein